MPLTLLLNGSLGRMGQAITAVATESDCTIIATCDAQGDPSTGVESCDVVVDFSVHQATPHLIHLAAAQHKPVVIGTTGHNEEERTAILAETKHIPIVWAGNYSIGVNVLFWLTQQASRILGPEYNPEIVEMHHRHKLDAPSGTAERLIEVVAEGRQQAEEHICHGRQGIAGPRKSNEIGVHALRGGSVVGDHEVIFAGEGERISLSHQAGDRKIFALGALRAAHWVRQQAPGLYRMEDVLGLTSPETPSR